MALHNDPVWNALQAVTERVYYLFNDSDNSETTNELPYIVMQVISRKPITADNKPLTYKVEYQITLVTRNRSEELAHRLEEKLEESEIIPVMISTYKNEDYSMSRVYSVEIISKGGY